MALPAKKWRKALERRMERDRFVVQWNQLYSLYGMHRRRVVTVPIDANSADQPIYASGTQDRTVAGVTAIFATASTSGTMMLKRCTAGQAPSAGTDLLTGTMSLAGSANTQVAGTLITGSKYVSTSQHLALDFGGDLSNLAGCVVTVDMYTTGCALGHIMYIAHVPCKLVSLIAAADNWGSSGYLIFLKADSTTNPTSGDAITEEVDISSISSAWINHEMTLVSDNDDLTFAAGDRLIVYFDKGHTAGDATPGGFCATAEFERLE